MSEMTVRARVTNFYNLPDWPPDLCPDLCPDWPPDWCRRVGAAA
jgi:hypothetical protein